MRESPEADEEGSGRRRRRRMRYRVIRTESQNSISDSIVSGTFLAAGESSRLTRASEHHDMPRVSIERARRLASSSLKDPADFRIDWTWLMLVHVCISFMDDTGAALCPLHADACDNVHPH